MIKMVHRPAMGFSVRLALELGLVVSFLLLPAMVPSVEAGQDFVRGYYKRKLLAQSYIPIGRKRLVLKIAEMELKQAADPAIAHCFHRSLLTLGHFTVTSPLESNHSDLTALQTMPELKVYMVAGSGDAKKLLSGDVQGDLMLHGRDLTKVVGAPAQLPGGFDVCATILDLVQLLGKSLDSSCEHLIGSRVEAHVKGATSPLDAGRMLVCTGAAA